MGIENGTRILCKNDLFDASNLTSLRSDSLPNYKAIQSRFYAENQPLNDIKSYEIIAGSNLVVHLFLETTNKLWLGRLEIPFSQGFAAPISTLAETDNTLQGFGGNRHTRWAHSDDRLVYLDSQSKKWTLWTSSSQRGVSLDLDSRYRLPAIGSDSVAFVDSSQSIVSLSLKNKTLSHIYKQQKPGFVVANLVFGFDRWYWLQYPENTVSSALELRSSNGEVIEISQISKWNEMTLSLSSAGFAMASSFDKDLSQSGMHFVEFQSGPLKQLTKISYPPQWINRFAKLEFSAALDSLTMSSYDHRVYLSPRFYGGVFSYSLVDGVYRQHATDGGLIRCFQIATGPESL